MNKKQPTKNIKLTEKESLLLKFSLEYLKMNLEFETNSILLEKELTASEKKDVKNAEKCIDNILKKI
jgi:hypothetical protein